MKMHLRTDHTTGATTARGRSGRYYTTTEIARAQAARRAPGSDPEGEAYADDIDRSGEDLGDPRAWLEAEMHDCPACRRDRALGIEPTFVVPKPAFRKPKTKLRWREQRRRSRKAG
jgi:hypothetical protein